jgi:hypothetical protein
LGAAAVIGEQGQAQEHNCDERGRESESAKLPHGLYRARLGFGPSSVRPFRNC